MTTVYLHSHAADSLRKLKNHERLIGFLNRLEANPTETLGDYAQPDPRGRMIEVKIIGRHAVLFFKDPFADLVKILDIRNVEAL
ncbi:MAG: hypothetical protein AB8F34_00335 [Akkermansiaceae bacterium]